MKRDVLDDQRHHLRQRPLMTAIRWSAIFGGLFVGVASYLVVTLLGVALGLSIIEPQPPPQPLGAVSVGTAVWTGVSLLIATFIAGSIGARMSGLTRWVDGVFHGVVTWAAMIVLITWLTFSSVGFVLGGAFLVFNQGLQGVSQIVLRTEGTQGAIETLQLVMTGPGDFEIDRTALDALQARFAAQDRPGAIRVLTEDIGLAPEQAAAIVDQGMIFLSEGTGRYIREISVTTGADLRIVSWWILGVLLLSLISTSVSGMLGAKAARRSRGHRLRQNERVDMEKR